MKDQRSKLKAFIQKFKRPKSKKEDEVTKKNAWKNTRVVKK